MLSPTPSCYGCTHIAMGIYLHNVYIIYEYLYVRTYVHVPWVAAGFSWFSKNIPELFHIYSMYIYTYSINQLMR